MKRFFWFVVAAVLAFAPASAQSPQVRALLLGPRPAAAVAGAAYTGPGDVTGWSGAYGYWGLRSYTAAGIGGALVDLVDQSGANPITINSAANGYIDTAAISAWVTAHSVTTIRVNKIYDQISTQHLIYVPVATRPALVLSSVGGLPALNFNGTGGYMSSSANATAQAQPLTVAAISASPTFATTGGVFSDGTFNFQCLSMNGVASVGQYFGVSTQSYTNVADGTFASLISVDMATPSSMSVNGTITGSGGNAGSNGIGSTNKLTLAASTDGGAQVFNGSIFEVLVKAGAVSPTNQGLLTANQRAIGTGF